MFCSQCGNELLDTDKFCTKCGTPVPGMVQPAAAPETSGGEAAWQEVIDEAVPVEVAKGAVLAQAEGAQESAPAVSAEEVKTTDTAAGAVPASAPTQMGQETVPAQAMGTNVSAPVPQEPMNTPAAAAGGSVSYLPIGAQIPEEPKKKEKDKKGKGTLIAVLSVVVVLLLIIIVTSAKITNFFRRTFSSPENYYRYVEGKSAEEMSAVIGDIYTLYLNNLNAYYNQNTSATVSIELGWQGQDLLGMVTDADWLDKLEFGVDTSVKDGVIGADFVMSLNEDDIVSFVMLMDVMKENLYLQFPEFTETYLGIEMKDYMNVETRESLEDLKWQMEIAEKIQDVMPKQAEVEKILNRYFELILGCIDDVDKSSTRLEAGDVEVRCTALEVVIDSSTLREIADTLLEELQDDSELEEIIIEIAEAGGLDGEDVYREFLNTAEEFLDELRGLLGSRDKIVMTVYVDGKGDIIGRTVKTSGMTIDMLMPQKGKNFGYELSVSVSGVKLALTGEGRRSGSKIDGEFKLRLMGMSLLNIDVDDLDLEKLKRNQSNGKVEISLTSAVVNLLGVSNAVGEAIGDMRLVFDAQTKDKSSKSSIQWLYGDEKVVSITVSTEWTNGKTEKIPSDRDTIFMDDTGDLAKWIQGIDWDKVISNMEKTDLPSEVIGGLEDIRDFIEESGEYLEDVLDLFMLELYYELQNYDFYDEYDLYDFYDDYWF